MNEFKNFTFEQLELIHLLTKINSQNLEITQVKNDTFITVSNTKKNNCPFKIILHNDKDKISFIICDVIIINYENYLEDEKFKNWIKRSIDLFLTSNVLIKDYFYRDLYLKKDLFIFNYQTYDDLDFPVKAIYKNKYFWQECVINISKYEPWLIEFREIS